MKKYWITGAAAISIFALFLSSCKDKKLDPYASYKGNYFSVRQFAQDEWNTFSGEPFVILKTVRSGNKTDSSYTNSDTLNWAGIFKIFFATEISDRKYLGKYNFTQFDDDDDRTRNFFYQVKEEADDANDPLFTRKLLITADAYTMKVKGIYIETEKRDFFEDNTQKLYYKPMKTIQIQETDNPKVGPKKETITQYDFER